MGYSINKFVCVVDPNLICGICGCVLQDAVLTPCGHTFCCLCLETWLSRPGTDTCPECRTFVGEGAKPVHSLRNLINGFEVECDHAERGCKSVLKLERLKSHLDSCKYFPVECAGCDELVSRAQLATHQIQCPGIAASVDEDDDGDIDWGERLRRQRATDAINNAEIAELLCRISSLELQVAKFKRDVELANAKNKLIENQYRKVKEELNRKRHEVLELQSTDYDPKYDYGHTPQSISRLSLLIAKYLLRKPSYIDSDSIFGAIKLCYEQYFRYNSDFEHDVHMLLATAYASNWFNSAQRLSISCWLQCLARYRHDNRLTPIASVR